MEEILKESAKQVPALVVLCLMAWTFAKAGSMIVQSFLSQASEARSEYLKAIERFHDENMEARTLSRQAVTDASVANDRQSEAINALTLEVRELRSTLAPVIRRLAEA